jgi:hypothetical protein
MYDFSSSEWEMMEESTLIDWQQVGKPGQSCAAEHFTLDLNLNVLKKTGNFSFFDFRRRTSRQTRIDSGASQAVRHHVRYCRRLRA